MAVIGIPPDRALDLWPVLRGFFASFAERSGGAATERTLFVDVLCGQQQCWVFHDNEVKACMLTRVEEAQIKMVTITHCAGHDREEWQEAMISEIFEWANHIGAKRVVSVNRPGWTPFLKTLGMRETHRIMEIDLG